jgi:hypothetical protein
MSVHVEREGAESYCSVGLESESVLRYNNVSRLPYCARAVTFWRVLNQDFGFHILVRILPYRGFDLGPAHSDSGELVLTEEFQCYTLSQR